MSSFLNIAADEEGTKGGGGPDDDSRFPERTLRSHGFSLLAFGLALGFTLMIFFGFFAILKEKTPLNLYENWVQNTHPNLWFTFLIGFIVGILISAIYNFLLFRRFTLFGLDRGMD